MQLYLLYLTAVSLSILRNGISQAFCPVACECSGTEIDCSSKNIAEITWKFPKNTTKINLSFNNLTQLNTSSFEESASTLVTLDISGNDLTSIHNGLVQTLPQLSLLNFSNNDIASLPFSRKGLFQGNSKLRTLDLSHNRLPLVGGFAFQNLPLLEEVHLDGNLLQVFSFVFFGRSPISTVSLKDNLITYFAFGVRSAVKTLDISGNKIEIAKSNQLFLKSPELSDLRIGNANLTYDITTFAGLRKLEHLKFVDYSQPKLTSDVIRADTPAAMSLLQSLSVSGGSLNRVELESFQFLSSLTLENLLNLMSLTITSCDDITLNSVKLINVPSFTELKLVKLGLTSANMSLFSGALDSLVTLNLSRNKLHELPKRSMDGLLNLEILDLSNNRLTKIDFDAFASLPRLRILDLSANLLASEIDANFIRSPRIRTLNLAYNLFREATLGPYWSLPSLQSMDISFNYIKTLHPGGNSSIHYNLQENKWNCTCELYRLLSSESMRNSCSNTTTSICFHCSSPKKYSRSSVFDLKDTCYDVETSTKQFFPAWAYIVILAVAGGLLVFFVLLVVFVFRAKKSNGVKNNSYPSSPTEEPMVNKPAV